MLLDHTTLLRKRLSYARVCVEIDASKTLVKEYDLHCPNGLFKTISAEYEWIPSKCSNCNVFGHTTALCATNNIDNLKVVAEGTWIRSNLLRGRNFWTIKTPQNCSWAWGKILKLRSLAWPKMKYIIGDGDEVHHSKDPTSLEGEYHRFLIC